MRRQAQRAPLPRADWMKSLPSTEMPKEAFILFCFTWSLSHHASSILLCPNQGPIKFLLYVPTAPFTSPY